jgi:hypothetical protein
MNEPNTWHKPYRYEKPTFGYFGRLTIVGDKVICHFCGRLFRSVAVHAVQAHGVKADEYREIVGLGRMHALEGPATKHRRAEHGHRMITVHGSHLKRYTSGGPKGPVRLEVLIEKRETRDRKQSATKRRGTCSRGHAMSEAYVRPVDGKRRCRACAKESNRRWYERHKGAVTA